ncbi:MAG: UDP-glucose--hexose-1-phosphate uridylyltransferase [Chitinophagaceae bacterium]
MFDLSENAHTRLNILTGDWILVSPHRTKRPWQGKTEKIQEAQRPSYDPSCYLCPRNTRADGTINPDYKTPFSFTNDFSALLENTEEGEVNVDELLKATGQKGICRVVTFSSDHSVTLPLLSEVEIGEVITKWITEFKDLASHPFIKYVQIFENKGEIMGCSNPHPHGQIWSQSSLPLEIVKETTQQKNHYEEKGNSLLADYLALEIKQGERMVIENKHFVALVPFWATWPYEVIIISRRQVQTIEQFSTEEQAALASILKRLTTKYDNLFEISFPYSAGMHQAPVNDGPHPEWHWHMHFYPPLLRSATVKKFMVGYEMLANPQRDFTPEWAAEKLRSVSEVHYKTIQ